MPIWRVWVPSDAKKAVARFPRADQARILRALGEMEEDPLAGDVRQLGPNAYRRRIGDYRITFVLHPVIRFLEVQHIFRKGSKSSRHYRPRR